MIITRHQLHNCNASLPPHGYTWTRNSCYLDTVLWVLFSMPHADKKLLFSKWDKHRITICSIDNDDTNRQVFQEFQQEFRRAAYYFRCGHGGGSDCSSFRKLYKKWHEQCPMITKNSHFHSSEQHEAQEFLQFVLSLYGMNGQKNMGAVSMQEFYYGVSSVPRSKTSWRFIYDRRDKTQSIVWNISYQSLLNAGSMQERSLDKFLRHKDEIWNIERTHKHCLFNSIRTYHSLIQFADILVFSVERANPLTQNVAHFQINIPPTMTDSKQKTLTLTGIICHKGESAHSGHYIAYVYSRNNRQWYAYDDISVLPVRPIDKLPRDAYTHCVLVFYYK